MSAEADSTEIKSEQVSVFQLVVLFLSIYAIIILAVQAFFKLPPKVSNLLESTDIVICAAFLFDFFYRLSKAPNKWQFMKWGWIDLISSIPALEILRFGRIYRVIKILRMLRAFKSVKVIIAYIYFHRNKSIISTVAAIGFILVIVSSIAMISFEDTPASNIKTAGDALWWAMATITTIGYGDKYPVTVEGKIVAVILMVVGVGLFATFTAYIASLFLETEQKKEEVEISALHKELISMRKKIESIENLLKKRRRL